MRKTSAVLASLSLAVLALTGCSTSASSADASCDRGGADEGILNVADVSGEFGESPDVEFFGPVDVDESAFADVTVGDGRAVTTESQPLVLDFALYSGETGEKVFSTEFNGDRSRVQTSADVAALGIGDALDCATAGSRVLAVLTPEDFGPQNSEALGLAADENVVAVIDVVDVLRSRASGALQFNDAQGMPTVVRAPDGTPGVIIPDSAPPKKGVTQTLIKGDGAVVKEGDTVFTNIMAVNWDDKTVTSSSWGSKPSSGAAAQELVGATVGSQLLVVIPASEGSPATAIVVDILGVVPASTP